MSDMQKAVEAAIEAHNAARLKELGSKAAMRSALAAALPHLVSEERERCARIAERDRRNAAGKECGYEPKWHLIGKEIANEIRGTHLASAQPQPSKSDDSIDFRDAHVDQAIKLAAEICGVLAGKVADEDELDQLHGRIQTTLFVALSEARAAALDECEAIAAAEADRWPGMAVARRIRNAIAALKRGPAAEESGE